MEHNNIVTIEDENMILGEIFSSASIELDMPDVETFMEEVDSSQPMDMQEEDTINDTCLVPLRTLMDIDTIVTRHIPPTGAVSLTPTAESSKEKVRKRKTRGPYRRYSAHQIEQLFDYVIEQGKTAKEAALLTGINIRTAQHYIKKYNDDEERRLPISGRKPGAGRKPKLTEGHSQFLIGYVDERPTAVLSDIRRALREAFPEISISISALHRHLVQKCKLTLKKLEKIPAARNSERVLKLRRERIEEWEAIPELDFAKNCVFIDEAGFNLHTQRNYGCSRKGTPAKGIVPTAKGITITILGAISQAGVIDISLKKPQAVSMSKKRKANDTKAMMIRGQVGTRTEHFLTYLSNVIDVLDRNDMKGHYLVMDNAPIHTPLKVRELVESRGYKCLYLPPYSPFLNPIEEFWSKVKAGVRRNVLTADDRLSDRICESVQMVTRADCQAWIRHAVSFFPRCKREDINL
jgi:transposase